MDTDDDLGKWMSVLGIFSGNCFLSSSLSGISFSILQTFLLLVSLLSKDQCVGFSGI